MAQLQDLIVTSNSNLLSDAFATTQAAGNNTTLAATTEFVMTAIANALK